MDLAAVPVKIGAATVVTAVIAVRDAGDMIDEQTLECPRCGGALDDEYYGPCGSCRADLRATLGGEARSVSHEAYEPKMNVTPNAVASKD